MKTTLLAAALVAMAATAATPGFAMENTAQEAQAKIQRILASQKAETVVPAAPAYRATTLSMKESTGRDRYEAARIRLFGNRAGPSGK